VTQNFAPVAQRLVVAKARYQAVEAKTEVPWWFIAVIHQRESSQNWAANLAQGDPWNRVSVHVPAGRGPFASWEDAAVDALVNCAPHAAANKDWSSGGALTMLEEYNGLGYAGRGVPSPYLWAGTDQYRSGKYVRDGVYDASVVDTQLGCAGLLLAMVALDRSVTFDGKLPPMTTHPEAPHAPPEARSQPRPSIARPAKGSIGAFIASLFSTVFNAKRN
jgi:lysozyme family protein